MESIWSKLYIVSNGKLLISVIGTDGKGMLMWIMEQMMYFDAAIIIAVTSVEPTEMIEI